MYEYVESDDIEGLWGLKNLLLDNGPLYAYYKDNSGSHMVVVTGADCINNKVYTNNPSGTLEGYKAEQSYSDFLNTYYPYEKNDNRKLEGIFIPN